MDEKEKTTETTGAIDIAPEAAASRFADPSAPVRVYLCRSVENGIDDSEPWYGTDGNREDMYDIRPLLDSLPALDEPEDTAELTAEKAMHAGLMPEWMGPGRDAYLDLDTEEYREYHAWRDAICDTEYERALMRDARARLHGMTVRHLYGNLRELARSVDATDLADACREYLEFIG